MQLMKSLSESSPKILLSDFQYMIINQWDAYFYFALLQTLLYILMTALLIYNVIFNPGELGSKIVVILICAYFLIVKAKIIYSQGWHHLKSVFNCFDLLTLILTFIVIGLDEATEDAAIIFNAVALGCIFTRAILSLRVFNTTRFLIAMIVKVFVDIIPFLLILLSYLVQYTFIDQQLSRLTGSMTNYSDFIKENYVIAYGDWEIEGFTTQRWIIFIIHTIVGPLVLMNLLISVISDTFNQFIVKKQEENLKELL